MVVWSWKKPKCATCTRKFKPNDRKHLIRLQSIDGISEIEVCDNCANFWDASTEVLQKRRKDEDDE